MSVKINSLQIENLKRVKAVTLKPSSTGLTILGGKNGQGKTSVLDAICWALGGNKFKPSNPHRDDSVLPPTISITLSNGLIVERKGKNSDLKVIDPSGSASGQRLLDEFISQLALDLPKFINSNNSEKAKSLLQIIGVGEQLAKYELEEKTLFNQRHTIGQIADQKEKYFQEMPFYADAPEEPVTASELIKQQQEILVKNGENQRQRNNLDALKKSLDSVVNSIASKEDEIYQTEIDFSYKLKTLKESLANMKNKKLEAEKNISIATKTVEQLQDECTDEIEAKLSEIDSINQKVRINNDKRKAEDEAVDYKNKYDSLTTKIEDIRKSKLELLKSADLPLPDLSVEDGELIYRGKKWDCMSGSEQLQVAVAIVRKLNPNCGFVLLDKLEQFDLDTLDEFGKWLNNKGLQVIATRVGTGEECSLIIEDGYGQQDVSDEEFYKGIVAEVKQTSVSVSTVNFEEGDF